MIDGYVTVKEKAEEWGIAERTLQALCAHGKVEGAAKFGNVWAIPVDTKHPPDGRVVSGKYINWRKKNSGSMDDMDIKSDDQDDKEVDLWV